MVANVQHLPLIMGQKLVGLLERWVYDPEWVFNTH